MAGKAHAGAWTLPAGRGQMIATSSYYATDQRFNNGGYRQAQVPYKKFELNPYFEYGLTDSTTAGASLSLQRAHVDGFFPATNWGIGDTEIFLRQRLMDAGGFVISLEPLLKLPGLESSDDFPQIGGRHPDVAMGLLFGYGFEAFGQNHFIALDTQYRYRFGSPQDQVKAAVTLGISFSPRFMLLSQGFGTARVKAPAVTSYTLSSGDDYSLLKDQLSIVYKLTDDVSLQAGGFVHQIGRNAGAGSGAFFSIWKSF